MEQGIGKKWENEEKLSTELEEKKEKLESYIRSLGSLAVGFSGGVDSTLLLAVAAKVLPADKVLAVTGADASVPKRELTEAENFCKERGIRHVYADFDPLQDEEYRRNGPQRCFYCKKGIFTEIQRIAAEHGIEYTAEGSNLDDLGDYRPGLKAAELLGVKCPLREAGLHKTEIRQLSKAMGLPTWSKPAYACLASRFVYGEEITREKLERLDQAEQFLIELGFLQERVRIHSNLARIEVPEEDIARIAQKEMRQKIWQKLKELGFLYVTLDLKGYQMGSMNATLGEHKEK